MKKIATHIHYYRTGNAFTCSTLALALGLLLLCFAQPSHAAITTTGDVDPANPSDWTSYTAGYIGETGDGTLDVNDGSDINGRYGYIGKDSGSTGAVTVDGNGSTWTNSRSLYVGSSGNGTLDITSGGMVSSGRAGRWG